MLTGCRLTKTRLTGALRWPNTVRFNGDEAHDGGHSKPIEIRITPVIRFDAYEGSSFGHDPQPNTWWRMLDAKWQFRQ